MAFKNGVVTILAVQFRMFNAGQQVSQFVPAGLGLKKGDRVKWECGQFSGTAEVEGVSDGLRNDVWCQLRKLN